LGFSSISQMGFILAAPAVGGFYAFTHGLAKSCLFLIAGNLPSRNFAELRTRGIELKIWLPLAIASLSICGFPLLAGFGAKVWMGQSLVLWQKIALNIATVGTVVTFAKFIFLPRPKLESSSESIVNADGETRRQGDKERKVQSGFWAAMAVLLGGLIVGNGVYAEAYALENLAKPLAIFAIGWSIYFVLLRRLVIKLPRAIEQFEHLIGGMSLVLILVFWMLQIQSNGSSYFS
ncbi:MAG: proton-conducting transporter membrane subunit, partial [Cyanobacteria bacterium J06600_6]